MLTKGYTKEKERNKQERIKRTNEKTKKKAEEKARRKKRKKFKHITLEVLESSTPLTIEEKNFNAADDTVIHTAEHDTIQPYKSHEIRIIMNVVSVTVNFFAKNTYKQCTINNM